MNNYQIESKLRSSALKELIQLGMVVWRSPKIRFYETDIFGIADIIAFHPATLNTYYIQLTTKSNRSARFKKMFNFLEKNDIITDEYYNPFELWLFDYKDNLFIKEKVERKKT